MTDEATKKPIRIALPGASGRMGQAITQAVAADDSFEIIATTKRGDDAKKLICNKPDVIVDFTTTEANITHAELAADAGIPIIIGTTGHNDSQKRQLEKAAKKVPIALLPNTSRGIGILNLLIRKSADILPNDWDVEIAEAHHRHKIDAPSGTALNLGEAIAHARKVKLKDVSNFTRHGNVGPREKDEIGFSVKRGGNVVGEHSVIFYSDGEEMEFRHRVTDRRVFAEGVLSYINDVIGLPPKLYSLLDLWVQIGFHAYLKSLSPEELHEFLSDPNKFMEKHGIPKS